MAPSLPYEEHQPTRAEIDALPGRTLLQFGTNWCGHCQAAEPLVDEALAGQGDLRRIKAEDGRGRPLGRSFAVKLWPTLIVLRDGHEVARLVRPTSAGAIREALSRG